MNDHPADPAVDPVETMWEGRYITVRRRGPWEYVGRARGIGAAVILAIDDGHVLLVEQYRVPMQARCLELPAGLVGDETDDEPVEVAAARELEEETGYRADHVASLGRFASSPGMVSETFMLVRATGLVRVSDGGGVAGEDIVVHRVPLTQIAQFVDAARVAGTVIDVKLLLLLGAGLLVD
ncbi:NUDIX hydrolase [Sphingomonas montana]|uniref:NUDIX hydrolase n=1 Tax=Sphingomonas montana TaxID=1843236 RepID=UPI00096F9FD1|nr:NUDIX hydrolase [Sphingomonas montana]